jgi:flagellar assembly protein FliH
VRSEREVAINVVKAALKAAILSEKVTIKLNPLDLDTAVEHKADLMDHIDGSPKVKLEKDEGVGQGGCVIETAYGNIDARLEEQMAEVEKVLEKELTV